MTATAAERGDPLRVLHLGKFLPPCPGGIERFLGELMPALRLHGVASAALVHAEPGYTGPMLRRQGRSPALRTPVLATPAFTPVSPSWPMRLQGMTGRWKPDLLHLHLPNPSAFWALMLPSARRLPWIVHWHADVPVDALDWRLRALYRIYRPLETAVLRRARTIIASSHAYAASSQPLRRWQDKVVVHPLGLPDRATALKESALWPDGTRLRLLFVGRFSYYKGIEHLVDAMARVPDDVRLVLVGDGERRGAIEQRISERALAGRVQCVGHLDDAALDRAVASADLLCLPSIERSEAFGLVLLEAMRAGTACLATAVKGSGMAEVVGDQAGVIVPPGDPAALAEAITQLAQDRARLAAMAAAGRQRFVTRFGIDAVASALSATYRAAL
ncbi:glycosyltransferase [Pseudofulvimonas gallinarii]|jgi:glycosyltransferase involved in cell wall biosynthesis|uniref:Glycosyltransferase involved in cell wall biosynthesis n=1 Tax=Pseudofulvimonas gallinarii TaxID=634155 RepID=A0A4R3LB69_9GAMM|nr:glycosyltransferase [Pseudofulvimonas gallinarii]TCS97391.1 glycosyltransferase involved in cell wall biosynthesis [Pseudofulvimonas gallinarii]